MLTTSLYWHFWSGGRKEGGSGDGGGGERVKGEGKREAKGGGDRGLWEVQRIQWGR